MKVSYFPGCTLKNKAKDLDIYARKCAEVLGVTLEEIENWQCCGGVFTMSDSERATKLSSVRALCEARDKNQPLVSVCSACHNVLKQTNHAMQTDAVFASRVNNYMADEAPYSGETQVLHYLELLRDVVGFDAVKNAVKNPRAIDQDLVDAQQARRALDRIVGYKISPLLWKKVKKGLSAGRVQSVATRLVVDREREIEAFIPEDYYEIDAVFNDFEAKLDTYNEKKIEIRKEKSRRISRRP